ncbi:MAG: NAD(P)-dependent glycerol-3-phosphate dehydrogenase [Actinomycetales bacterium]|nr:NAD(P)-dependent glycerol-3-phosphate dehydrogenase [Actinomycetales bacterium]
MRVTVLGAGSWGTALGAILATKGLPVTVWDIDVPMLRTLASAKENTRYLPGIRLPETMDATPDLAAALVGADLVIFAVPSHAMRRVAQDAREHLGQDALLCSVAKGIEVETLMTMSEVLEDVLPEPAHRNLTFLSGPSFAKEVARGLPTAVTIASRFEDAARLAQKVFHTRSFRPYTTPDVAGVEIGGCVKNVVAIAAGIADGLGYGENARAALITRGLAEIIRLAACKGANPLTLGGLAGLGDLVLTCSSDLSRNRTVGFQLGLGKGLEEIQAALGQVAEGVINARSTRALAQKYGVDMPISETVYRVIYEGFSPHDAGVDLMMRETKPEF